MNIKNQIRAEIMRLKLNVYDEANQFDIGARSSLTYLDSFLDTIPEQLAPEELEKEATKYSFENRPSIYGQVDIIDAFKAGAEWMAQQGWISVDEKLPEMDEEVIVLTDELGTAPIYKIAFGHIVDVERCIDYNGWNIPEVKYWMPCPEIPKE